MKTRVTRVLLVPGVIVILGAVAWVVAGQAPPAPEVQFRRAEETLQARFAEWRRQVQRAAERTAELAREGAAGRISLFERAAEIRRQEGVDGLAVVDWDYDASFWAGRTFDADPEIDFYDVRHGIEVVGVLDHPAHRVLYAARPAGERIAVAFRAFDERFLRGDDLAAKVAEEADLASVRLRYGSRNVPVRSQTNRPEKRVVVDGLVHATFLAQGEEERRAADLRASETRADIAAYVAVALAAWAVWVLLGLRLPKRALTRPLLGVSLIFGLRALLSTLALPACPLFHVPSAVHPLWAGPGDVLLTAFTLMVAAVWTVRGARIPQRRPAALALAAGGIAACYFLPGAYAALVEALTERSDGVVLFDPLQVRPGMEAAILLGSLCLLTCALFLVVKAVWFWARQAHPLLVPVIFLVLAAGLPPWQGAWLAAGCLLAGWSVERRGTSRPEKAAALTFLAAIASFPLLYAAEREGFVRDVAARAHHLATREYRGDVERKLASAVANATDPEEGADREVTAAIATGDIDRKHLAFQLWAASNWEPGEPCAVQVWDLRGRLLSSFDLDSPPVAWLPSVPASPEGESHLLFSPNEKISYYARDFVLQTLGDERSVGVARFLVPDRWEMLLSPLRPSMFSEPLDVLVESASPPLLLAELRPDGSAADTDSAAELDPPSPTLLAEARRRGHASTVIDYGGRRARLVLAPAEYSFAALVFAENHLQLGGFAFAKVLLTYSAVCLLYVFGLLVWRRGRVTFLFRHRVSLFLVILSAPPVLLLGLYNERVSNQRYEREIRERLQRRLDLAETLIGKSGGHVDNAWCAAFAADYRTDLNVYRGQELIATSRPGVWDTGLLGRRLAAPPFVRLSLEGRRDHVGHETFADPAGLRAAYRRIEGPDGTPLILAAPALEDRRAVERLAAEGNALLLAVFLMAATIVVFGGLFLSRSLTRPLHDLREATRRIALGELDAQLREGRRDEFGELLTAFNQMTIELRGAQDLRVRAEKAAAWREMARQIAHDIKNPLTPIKLTIQNLLAAHRSDPAAFEEEFEKGGELILEQIDALYRIAGDFSAFARLPERRLEPLALGPLMREIAALYRAAGGATVAVAPSPERVLVSGDRDELRRALINLVANARQASSRRVLLRATAEDGFARLDVEDDGTGIPPEVLARIFEPSFTTKTSGTGLGMPIVKRIVDDHGGTIAIDSTPGRGTIVTVRLPRSRESA